MARIEVAGTPIEVERVAASEESRFLVVVDYTDTTGATRRMGESIEGVARGDLTNTFVEEVLSELAGERDDVASVDGFVIVEANLARRGGEVEGEPLDYLAESVERGGADGRPTGHTDWKYDIGERLVYYEDGPDSSVYGYTTDGILVEAPPITFQNRRSLPNSVKLDIGEWEKIVPVEWIVGAADEEGVDIDRPREDL